MSNGTNAGTGYAVRAGKISKKKSIDNYSPEEMAQFIDSVANTENKQAEMYYGTRFMKAVLERDGVPGVITFVKKFNAMVDKTGKPLDYDFDGNGIQETRSILDETKLKPNRRDFLRSTLWTGAGALTLAGDGYWIAHGGAKTAAEAEGIYDRIRTPSPAHADKKEPSDSAQATAPDTRTRMQRIDDFFSNYVDGPFELGLVLPTETLIGVGLNSEGREKTREIKREQVANIVTEMAKKMGFRKQAEHTPG